MRIVTSPPEAKAELVIDPNRMLSRPIAFQGLEMIARRYPKVAQAACDFELPQLASGRSLDIREASDPLTFGYRLGVFIPKRGDHA